MRTITLHKKSLIESFLRRNTLLHLYELGDLDERFWPWTTWYGRVDREGIRAIALVYHGLALPTLLALGGEELPELKELLRSLFPVLPSRFYAHLNGSLSSVLEERYRLVPHGQHDKMTLIDSSRLAAAAGADVVRLGQQDLPQVLALYVRSYPGNWFEPQMIETGPYYGLYEEGRLVSVAGVHVYSSTYRIAALGNITTDPDYRGRGYARAVTETLCRHLLRNVEHIGLNVGADNIPAVCCYQSLGFAVCASYAEYMVEALDITPPRSPS